MSGRFAGSARVVAAALGVVVVSLVAMAVTVAVLARSGAPERWLRERLAAQLGPSVHFAAAHVDWWPRPALVLDGVALTVAAADQQSTTLAVARLRCLPRLRPLLSGDVVLGAVDAQGLRIRTSAPRGSGPGNPLDELLASVAAAAPAAPLPIMRVRDGDIEVDVASPSAIRMHIDTAQVTPDGRGATAVVSARLAPRGTVTAQLTLTSLVDAPTAGLTIAADAAELDAATLADWGGARAAGVVVTGTARVSAVLSRSGPGPLTGPITGELADGALSAADWRADAPLRLGGHGTWDGNRAALGDATLDAAHLAWRDLALDTLAASFTYGDGKWQIPAVEVRALGGSWHGAGRIAVGPPLAVDGTVAATALDAAAVSAVLAARGLDVPLPRLDAPLQLSATGSGSPSGAWNAHVELGTAGAATWQTTRVDGPLQISADASGTGTALALLAGNARAGRVILPIATAAQIDAAFEFDGRDLRLDPLRATAFGASWLYRGTVPTAAAAEWSGTVTGEHANVAALAAAVGAAVAASQPSGTIDATARISGRGTDSVVATAATVRLVSPTAAIGEAVTITAPAEVTGSVAYRDGSLQITDGRLRCDHARYGTLRAGHASMAFSAERDGTIHIQSAELTAYDGRWRGHGTLGPPGGVRSKGTLAVSHVDFDELLDAVAGTDADAPHAITAVADLAATVQQKGTGSVQGSVQVRLRAGRFAWDALQVDAPAQASGAVSITNGKLALTGVTANAGAARYGPVAAHNATAQFHYSDDRLTFDSLHFRAAAGDWTHSGWFTLDPGGRFAGQLSVVGVQPHALAVMLDETELELPFATLDADTEFSGVAVADWKPHLRMTGSVVLNNGTMESTAILRPIWNALVGSRMREDIDRPTRISELSATFTLRDAIFDTQDLSLVSDDYLVSGVGTIDMGGSLDLQTRIQLTSAGMQKMFLFAALPLPTGALPSLPVIPARVTGTMDHPSLRPNVSALPAATAKWFVDAVLHTPRSVGDAMLNGAGRLWNGIGGLFGTGRETPTPTP